MGQGLLFADEEVEVETEGKAEGKVEANSKAEVKPPKPRPLPPAGQQKQPEPPTRAARKIAPQSFDISYGGTTATMKFWLENSREGMWIRGLPGQSCPSAGPYFDREEAEEDMAGLRRFYEENPKYAF